MVRDLKKSWIWRIWGIGHLFQRGGPDVVWDTWELVAEGACEEYGKQSLENLEECLDKKLFDGERE